RQRLDKQFFRDPRGHIPSTAPATDVLRLVESDSTSRGTIHRLWRGGWIRADESRTATLGLQHRRRGVTESLPAVAGGTKRALRRRWSPSHHPAVAELC